MTFLIFFSSIFPDFVTNILVAYSAQKFIDWSRLKMMTQNMQLYICHLSYAYFSNILRFP